jgi:hypothetical protein
MKRSIVITTLSSFIIATSIGFLVVVQLPKNITTPEVTVVTTPDLPSTEDEVKSVTEPVVVPIVTTSTVVVSSSELPVVYKWAAEMQEAGIAEENYGIVTEILLDENGWRKPDGSGEKIWRYSTSQIGAGTLVGSLKFAQGWVADNYAGSWVDAQWRYVNSGNF